MDLILLAPIAGVLALAFAGILASGIMKKDPGNDKMKEIMGYIHEGAMAFLYREYRVLGVFIVVMVIVIGLLMKSWLTALCFVVGAIFSILLVISECK